MYGKVKNVWDIKTNGGGSSTPIDTSNFAKKNEANTFTQKNTFENTGNVINIKTTDDQAFGIEFKNSSDQAVAYVGGTSDNKAYLYSANGMKIETTNSPIEITPGTATLTYTSTNTEKNRREVLVRNDLYYVRVVNHGTFNIPANTNNNGYTTGEWTINGLTTGLNEFIIMIMTEAADITYDIKIYCNNLNYPNQSDIRKITASNWMRDHLDQWPTAEFGWIIHSNNKLRVRAKNLTNSELRINGIKIFHRKPGGLDSFL